MLNFFPDAANGARQPELTNPPIREHGEPWSTRKSCFGRDVRAERPEFQPSRNPSVRDLAQLNVQGPMIKGLFDPTGDTHAQSKQTM